jgi:hypothetical protein
MENSRIFEDLCDIDTCIIEKLSSNSENESEEFSYESYHSNESGEKSVVDSDEGKDKKE